MAKKKSSEARPTVAADDVAALAPATVPKPLVFVSHDSRDAEIAEAFSNLLTDASGGILRSFRSSDRRGTSGIEFGAEWYRAIMEKLGDATDVVALLTQSSIDRPWILYEAGVAKGKLNTIVFGLAIGVPLERASVGPFAQFQNSADDEDSLTKLVLQLIRRNPDADPREEAVRRQVQAFRNNLGELVGRNKKEVSKSAESVVDETAIAKLFEEVKVMMRDLPEQVGKQLDSSSLHKHANHRRARVHPKLVEELLFSSRHQQPGGQAAAWLLLSSVVRESMPWLADAFSEVYRAMASRNVARLEEARRNLMELLQMTRHLPFFEEMGVAHDKETYMLLRHLPEMLEHYFHVSALGRSSVLKNNRSKSKNKASAS